MENRHLFFKCFSGDCEGPWYLGITERQCPTGSDRQGIPWGSSEDHPNKNHLRHFLNTHLPGSGRAADRRDRIIRLCLGGTQEPAFVTLPVMGCIVKFQNHWFRQDFKANLWLIWKEIMFTHQYKGCLYPITLTFHCMLQTLLCFTRHVAHRNGKPISPIVLKWPSLVKHSWQFLSAFFECWFMA